jgi:hypothetical protein
MIKLNPARCDFIQRRFQNLRRAQIRHGHCRPVFRHEDRTGRPAAVHPKPENQDFFTLKIHGFILPETEKKARHFAGGDGSIRLKSGGQLFESFAFKFMTVPSGRSWPRI